MKRRTYGERPDVESSTAPGRGSPALAIVGASDRPEDVRL
jgi:hypothetical protein